MPNRGQRPFWIHQIAEYILGLVLVAQGLQSPYPLVPAVCGGLIVINASIVRGGAVSAFRLVTRAQHRVLDVAVIAITVVGALQPFVQVLATDRLVMIGVAAAQGFIWWNSSFAERQKRVAAPVAQPAAAQPGAAPTAEPTAGRSSEIGRSAGRLVGEGINAAKRFGKR